VAPDFFKSHIVRLRYRCRNEWTNEGEPKLNLKDRNSYNGEIT